MNRYKLAEKLSERLDEMGKDLTSMIEEVNGASATLSKTSKADEPVSYIPSSDGDCDNTNENRSRKSCGSSTRTCRNYKSSTKARQNCRARSTQPKRLVRCCRRASGMDSAVRGLVVEALALAVSVLQVEVMEPVLQRTSTGLIWDDGDSICCYGMVFFW